MFRRKKTPDEKADLIGDRLIGSVPEVVEFVLGQLQEKYNIVLGSGKNQAALLETFAFCMHIVDGMAFQALGIGGRAAFGDRLTAKVASVVASADIVERFLDTYNKRQLQYARCPEMLAAKGEALKGTLIWEFSKVLFELTGDPNPTTSSSFPSWYATCFQSCFATP